MFWAKPLIGTGKSDTISPVTAAPRSGHTACEPCWPALAGGERVVLSVTPTWFVGRSGRVCWVQDTREL